MEDISDVVNAVRSALADAEGFEDVMRIENEHAVGFMTADGTEYFVSVDRA